MLQFISQFPLRKMSYCCRSHSSFQTRKCKINMNIDPQNLFWEFLNFVYLTHTTGITRFNQFCKCLASEFFVGVVQNRTIGYHSNWESLLLGFSPFLLRPWKNLEMYLIGHKWTLVKYDICMKMEKNRVIRN